MNRVRWVLDACRRCVCPNIGARPALMPLAQKKGNQAVGLIASAPPCALADKGFRPFPALRARARTPKGCTSETTAPIIPNGNAGAAGIRSKNLTMPRTVPAAASERGSDAFIYVTLAYIVAAVQGPRSNPGGFRSRRRSIRSKRDSVCRPHGTGLRHGRPRPGALAVGKFGAAKSGPPRSPGTRRCCADRRCLRGRFADRAAYNSRIPIMACRWLNLDPT